MQTLNQLNKAFNDIATAHKQINTYGFGQIHHIATSGTIQYPILWVELENVVHTSHMTNQTFTFYVMDIVKNDRSNETEVLSDMIQIAEDLIAELKHPDWTFDVVVNQDVPIDYYTEGMTDKVTGVRFSLTIPLERPDDRCAIPTNSITRT